MLHRILHSTWRRRIEVLTNDDARSANEITLVSADSSLREAVAGERLFVAFDPSGGALIQASRVFFCASRVKCLL